MLEAKLAMMRRPRLARKTSSNVFANTRSLGDQPSSSTFGESEVSGVRSVCLDLVERSYLLVDAETLAFAVAGP